MESNLLITENISSWMDITHCLFVMRCSKIAELDGVKYSYKISRKIAIYFYFLVLSSPWVCFLKLESALLLTDSHIKTVLYAMKVLFSMKVFHSGIRILHLIHIYFFPLTGINASSKHTCQWNFPMQLVFQTICTEINTAFDSDDNSKGFYFFPLFTALSQINVCVLDFFFWESGFYCDNNFNALQNRRNGCSHWP